ncbi:actin [Apiospora arundinis]
MASSQAGPSKVPPIDIPNMNPTPPASRPRAASKASQSKSLADPVLRNAIRYTMSPSEYESLHKYVLSRSRVLRRRAPSVLAVEKYAEGGGDPAKGKLKGRGKDASPGGGNRGDSYNARAVRHALRVFVATNLGMKLYDMVMARVKGQKDLTPGSKKEPFYKSLTLRLSLSLSTILLLYRLLFRFLGRLRMHLLEPSSEPFRARNPRTAKTLTSPLCASRRRQSGRFRARHLPVAAAARLLHAVTLDRECSPVPYVDFIWKSTSTYLHSAPKDLPAGIKWPAPWDVADSLAQMAKLNWPPFVSPALFPNQETLPACATLHGADPSCLRTYLTFWVRSFPRIGRAFLVLYSLFLIPRYKSLYNAPMAVFSQLLSQTLRLSTFVTGAISTAWASICFFQTWFPRHFMATQRFFLGGFLAGLWGFVERKRGRGIFLYSARTSVDSLWKVGVKRRWWKAMKGGDLWVFVVAIAITGAVYERDAKAVREAGWRKGVSWVRGTEWRDWGVEEDEDDNENEKNEEGVMVGGVKEE